ncbi:hypothetical protein GN109_10485 [Collimonas pratensis]|uniref:Lipoprotein n=1 Tax=Collimonas pratensis TaxID=279113 RepID=A0A127Q4B0_9BURK|nr:hypothetical protein [Collimonas pratensis]AMP04482.1 hypothetical protein CPter91_2114 [Collimonas pratensis]NKI69848.1 hypothetical protein [Collimonas pratensis]
MSNHQLPFSSSPTLFKRQAVCLTALLALCMSFSAMAAAGDSASATARYQAERAACNNGRSNQDRATCLKEAGAALAESRRGRLSDNPNADRSNALLRCNALPADDRDACQRRMNGEGTTSGSALEGGISRELTVPDRK